MLIQIIIALSLRNSKFKFLLNSNLPEVLNVDIYIHCTINTLSFLRFSFALSLVEPLDSADTIGTILISEVSSCLVLYSLPCSYIPVINVNFEKEDVATILHYPLMIHFTHSQGKQFPT